MPMTLHLDIVSAEGEIFSGVAEMVFVPALMGDVGITPRHAPLITPIKPGDIRVQIPNESKQRHFFISGGMLEVQSHVTTVLADTIIRATDLDENSARLAKEAAEKALKDSAAKVEDYNKIKAELAEAVAQLRMIQQLKK